MTREFLKNLGLEDAAIDKILDENMSDIGKEKRKTDAAESKLEAAKSDLAAEQKKGKAVSAELDTLKKANGDIAAVQQQLTELQTKYDTDIKSLQDQLADRNYSDAITRAISDKGLKFSSKSAERAFIAALKEKKLELKEGELSGLDDFIKEQKETDPEAFAPDKAPPKIVGGLGGGHSAPENATKTAAEQLAMNIGKTRAESVKTANDIISMYTGGNRNGT